MESIAEINTKSANGRRDKQLIGRQSASSGSAGNVSVELARRKALRDASSWRGRPPSLESFDARDREGQAERELRPALTLSFFSPRRDRVFDGSMADAVLFCDGSRRHAAGERLSYFVGAL